MASDTSTSGSSVRASAIFFASRAVSSVHFPRKASPFFSNSVTRRTISIRASSSASESTDTNRPNRSRAEEDRVPLSGAITASTVYFVSLRSERPSRSSW